MSVPTHGSFCQTKTYPVKCWACQKSIFVFQCTCGSCILFDDLGDPWPRHQCMGDVGSGGIGGSGFSGWQAVEVLRSRGYPITDYVLDKIFPKDKQKKKTKGDEWNRSIDPEDKKIIKHIFIVREISQETKKTLSLKSVSSMGAALLNIPPGGFIQITIVDNSGGKNLTYTCFVDPKNFEGVERNQMVFAELRGHVSTSVSGWIVEKINLVK